MRLASTATAAIVAALSCLAHASPPDDLSVASAPPVVVKTVPEAGSIEVDPTLKQITITFSKEMTEGSFSIVNFSPGNAPKLAGKPSFAEDKKTCVVPVSLEAGRCYAVWLNTARFQNFKDADARPAVPYLLVFETKG